MSNDSTESAADFESRLSPESEERYVLRLYVSGMTMRSADAIERTKAICDEYLQGRYELEVVDIFLQPEMARTDQIVAAPTLVKRLPPPLRRLVGDLSDRERVLIGLDLQQKREMRPEDHAGY